MKILVTGGGGYLGSVLVPVLLGDGHSVTVVDTFVHGVPSLAAWINSCPGLTVRRLDVRSNEFLSLIPDHDVTVLLAAVVGAPACTADPLGATTINQASIEDAVAAARDDQLIIYPCTNSGYGLGGESECTEDSPLTPLTLYGQTKVAAEKVVLSHPRGVSLRFATLFGASPRMRLDLMVNDFVYRALHDRSLVLFEPHFRRNFLHVRDAAAAIRFAIERGGRQMLGRAFNVGDTRANMTKAQLAQIVAEEVLGTELFISERGADPDKRDYVISNARIEALGWRPQSTLREGIKELLRAYRAMPYARTPWRNA